MVVVPHGSLCQLSPDEIEALVERAVCEGGRQHFILGTSDVPISAIDDRLKENLSRFIEAGINYGTFSGDDL